MSLFSKVVNLVKNVLNSAASPQQTYCMYCDPPVPTPTINELKDKGYKVRVTHLRNYWNDGAIEWEDLLEWKTTKELREMKEKGFYNCDKLSQWGGATVVQLSKDNEDKFGVAVCSEMDNFNRKLGLSLAIERALS